MDVISGKQVSGRVRPRRVVGKKWYSRGPFKPNLVLNEWASLTAKLLTTGDAKYRIAGMYLEFENTVSPGDPVTPPTYNRTRSIEYYNDLSGSATRDYIRVPMTASVLASDGVGFTDNVMTFFARSRGIIGVHGKTFSSAVNSVVFGASLVAFVDATDATQDLLFSTFYFDVSSQQEKLSTGQIGIEWELALQ